MKTISWNKCMIWMKEHIVIFLVSTVLFLLTTILLSIVYIKNQENIAFLSHQVSAFENYLARKEQDELNSLPTYGWSFSDTEENELRNLIRLAYDGKLEYGIETTPSGIFSTSVNLNKLSQVSMNFTGFNLQTNSTFIEEYEGISQSRNLRSEVQALNKLLKGRQLTDPVLKGITSSGPVEIITKPIGERIFATYSFTTQMFHSITKIYVTYDRPTDQLIQISITMPFSSEQMRQERVCEYRPKEVCAYTYSYPPEIKILFQDLESLLTGSML